MCSFTKHLDLGEAKNCTRTKEKVVGELQVLSCSPDPVGLRGWGREMRENWWYKLFPTHTPPTATSSISSRSVRFGWKNLFQFFQAHGGGRICCSLHNEFIVVGPSSLCFGVNDIVTSAILLPMGGGGKDTSKDTIGAFFYFVRFCFHLTSMEPARSKIGRKDTAKMVKFVINYK